MFKLIIGDKKEEKEIPNNDYKIIDLLKELDLPVETVVTKKNKKIVIEESKIDDGDEIEIIQVIYGG
jgi:sulfur carrier protein